MRDAARFIVDWSLGSRRTFPRHYTLIDHLNIVFKEDIADVKFMKKLFFFYRKLYPHLPSFKYNKVSSIIREVEIIQAFIYLRYFIRYKSVYGYVRVTPERLKDMIFQLDLEFKGHGRILEFPFHYFERYGNYRQEHEDVIHVALGFGPNLKFLVYEIKKS
jgi:hypothetical protein